ncbi:ATP-binding cassette domain-containing protein [Treponema parvum]|uniref:ATP-binding cassette domain-containing protein n=1 Tax=Treponema parvum TaxID=138851 RepID=A0A975F4Z6_9SPIR|nr:ATP-binding cassette domain-containing protein [Treponema parvum]QTQ14343.1 ATP-binding cassette domain-containing protein [Treponema parvum]
MKKFFQFLKTRPIAFVSVIFIVMMYVVMIFAEFFAPYPAAQSFEAATFHPANVEFSLFNLTARECRVLDPVTWQYARVKGEQFHHKIDFFVHGTQYKLLGFIPCDVHLFGSETDPATGSFYPVFLFGADNLGRDLFSRIVYGSRISLTVGFLASAVSLFLAILLGGLAGYYGGAADWSIMRFAEFFMLIPALYLILFLRSLLNTRMDSGTSYIVITMILSLVGWPGSARTIRGIVHSVKREEFIINSKLEGIPSGNIIFFQIIPQISSLLIVSAALSVPGFIMSETTLSYLGLGISDPAVSWGSLINRDISTLNNLQNYPWLLTPVWLLLVVTLAFNFFGDALRDFFDPYHAVFHTFRRPAKSKSKKAALQKDERGENKSRGENESRKNESADTYRDSLRSERVSRLCSADAPLLFVRDLFVTFSVLRGTKRVEVKAVKGISYELYRGEILGIVGESGSGKSVSVSAIPSLLPENAFISGNIFYDGVDLVTLPPESIRSYRGKKIAFIFQEPGRSFDPLQNIGGVFFETLRNVDPAIGKEEAFDKASQLLTEVGISEPRERLVNFPHQFSGGQLQRIGIALALAEGCELLIADEPTTALDVTIQAQIVSLLLKLRKTRGLSIIFISHNIELVAQISDRIAVMYGGKIVESGTAEQIYNHPEHDYTKALLSCLPQFGMHYTASDLKTYSSASLPSEGNNG